MSRILSFFVVLSIALAGVVTTGGPAFASTSIGPYDCATNNGQHLHYYVVDTVVINTQNCDYLWKDQPTGPTLADTGIPGQSTSGFSFTVGLNGFNTAFTLFYENSNGNKFDLTLHPMQGGSDGVIFFTEQSDGAIYVGDFNSTSKSTYWQHTGSRVDEVAVTKTRVAWASRNAPSGSLLEGKIYISDIGRTAGAITEVEIPGTPIVTALAADFYAERFYVTTNNGNIYSFDSDGTDLQLQATDTRAISDVIWGLTVDSSNSKLYFCTFGSPSGIKELYSSSIAAGGLLSTPTLLKSLTQASCDGLGVDPITKKVFMTRTSDRTSFDTYLPSTDTLTSVNYVSTLGGTAPSSMFVNSSTGKFYFTTETNVYEANFDGTGLSILYTGTHTANGFENLAVYFGATLESVGPGGASQNQDSSGSGSNGADVPTPGASASDSEIESSSALAVTGNADKTPVALAGGFLVLAGLASALLAVARRRAKQQ